MLNKRPEWQALQKHAEDLQDAHVRDLFAANPSRFDDFHLKHDGALLDYSKNLVTADTVSSLADLAKSCDVEGWRAKMIAGEVINTAENRAARHMDLRKSNPPQEVQDVHARMYDFCETLYAEGRIKHVVNIGIGGSDLGGKMAYMALTPFQREGVRVHFISNVDGSHLVETLKHIKAEETLFIVSSKSFTTQETMMNARSARAWLEAEGVKDVSAHFVAVSSNIEAAQEFGITPEHIFPMWDWVGGRFSVWSAIGLPLCIGIGSAHFKAFLAGGRNMDAHFVNAPLEQNMPVMLALIGIWNRNFMGYPALCIAPYDHYLRYFCDYMRQLDMESNGKSVDRYGRALDHDTSPIVFGEVGTNGQHAFFQLLHQGSVSVPCDFVVVKNSQNALDGHHAKLVTNALAQAQAMMAGQDNSDLHHHFEGNRPSNMVVLDELNPYGLGQLMALYEHKIFVQGAIWGVNSFDQCGVELGKTLARGIEDGSGALDGSTAGLMRVLGLI